MINKVTYSEQPELFDDITEFSIEEDLDHRRGSSFYREDIIEFKPKHKIFFEDVPNFEDYIGTWQTNNVMWSEDDGFDSEFSELTRVKKVEKITYKWKPIE